MIWHITKRELYDNLNSLRFALTTILLLTLMLTNAIVHLREHPHRIQTYQDATAKAERELENRSTNIYRLAVEGPGLMYKTYSSLIFCAEGDEPYLSMYVRGENYYSDIANVRPLWRLSFPQKTPNISNIRPDFTTLDWSFIVSYILSFVAILFAFDSVSGELERGTLRLTLANPIPRHTVLTGKFLGTFLSINIPFTLSILMNLLLISSSDVVQLNMYDWGRIGLLYIIIIIYTSLFIALSILVSAAVRQSGVSLVVLLLIWVSFVIFMPNTLASVGSRTVVPIVYVDSGDNSRKIGKDIREEYQRKYGTTELSPSVHVIAEFIAKEAIENERFNENYLKQQITQGKRARVITRLSPAAIVQHLFQSFAGTGFERHLQFLDNVRDYAREYSEFIIDADRADPESVHAIGVPEGMSQKSVNPDAIPKFKDTLSITRDINAAAMDLFILLLFLSVLLAGSYLTFIRLLL